MEIERVSDDKNNVMTNSPNECHHEINVIISNYKDNPSILKIKDEIIITETFSFSKPAQEDIEAHIVSLDPKKAAVENDIPTKILIDTKDITGGYLTNIYCKSIENTVFPISFKKVDVIPSHKQLQRTLVKYYRPISLLPSVSKLYERDMYNQILTYMELHLSPYLFGFRKGHSTEQCLNVMLENWTRKSMQVQF